MENKIYGHNYNFAETTKNPITLMGQRAVSAGEEM